MAGVTQDAVAPGESFIYRFAAADAGTYWYHAHQVSSEAVGRGLFGVLVVEPRGGSAEPATDIVAPVHTFDGIPVVGDTDGPLLAAVIRVYGSGCGWSTPTLRRTASGERPGATAFTVVAVDGTTWWARRRCAARCCASRRAAGTTSPSRCPLPQWISRWSGARIPGLRLVPDPATQASGGAAFVDGPDLDLLSYGTPVAVPGMTDAAVDREAALVLDHQARFLDDIPALAQTINGDVHPFVPRRSTCAPGTSSWLHRGEPRRSTTMDPSAWTPGAGRVSSN